ncbi:MAG: mechanosensitive ion channel [Gemmatimonadetes bacterium]|nr:mechanosensitive ion channel [Gemmatimonadota bacterium]
MNSVTSVRDALTEIFSGLVTSAADLLPRLITGLVVLGVGWIVAKVFERVLRTTFLRLQVDNLLEKLGISGMASRFGIRGSLSQSTARLVYWLLIILFLRGAADAVGLDIVSSAIESFFGYLPNMIAALLVLVLGNVVAEFAGRATRESAADSGVDYAPALGRAVSAGVLFIVTIMAITQLGIDTEMIRTVVVIGLAGAALGLSLTFGLGTREITRNLFAGFYVRKLFRVGEPIELGDISGQLAGVTATKTLIEQADGKTVALPNREVLDGAVRV